MAQSTIASKIDDLERVYRMPEGDKIKAYLVAHPGIADILLEARRHIELQFGPKVVVELRFPYDYDGGLDGDLLAKIQSHDDADTTLDRFDKLWDEWFSEASGRPESFPLYIGLDYVEEPAE